MVAGWGDAWRFVVSHPSAIMQRMDGISEFGGESKGGPLVFGATGYSRSDKEFGYATILAMTLCGSESNITVSPTRISLCAEGKFSGESAMHKPEERAAFVDL